MESKLLEPKEALEAVKKEIWSYYDPQIFGFSEFDHDINYLTLKTIEIFSEIHNGKIWLGNVNLYGENRGKTDKILCEYTGQKVFNFDYSFMVPVYDETLVKMILDRDTSEYTGTKDDYKRVAEIHERIEQLGSVQLFWV